MKKTLYLMRHGQTLFNVLSKIQGWCDSPLTDEGKRQAEIAAHYFDDKQIDHYYSSTSERACDTLEIITKNKASYTRLKGIKEMNFGSFEGESEVLNPKTREDYTTFFVPYGGETIDQVQTRMNDTLTEIMEKENHQNVLAISHSGACMNFLQLWEENLEEAVKQGGVPNCCIFVYEYDDKVFKFKELIRHHFD